MRHRALDTEQPQTGLQPSFEGAAPVVFTPPKTEEIMLHNLKDNTLFTDEERNEALSQFLTNLKEADHTNIHTVLDSAHNVHTILINDGDLERAQILNDRLAPWDITLASFGGTAENANTTQDSQAVEEFVLLAGYTDTYSRIENLIADGQAFKAVSLLQKLDNFENLSPEHQQTAAELLKGITDLAEQSGDIDTFALATELTASWGLSHDAPDIIVEQALSRAAFLQNEQRIAEASTHYGPNYDNEPKQRRPIFGAPSF